MRYVRLKSFKERYKSLERDNKDQAQKAFRLFKENPRHPSLRVRKLPGIGIWYGHVTSAKVFTFHMQDDAYIFRNIGYHTILDEERRR